MNKPKRILIVGNNGAGKGLFAQELAKQLGCDPVLTKGEFSRDMQKMMARYAEPAVGWTYNQKNASHNVTIALESQTGDFVHRWGCLEADMLNVSFSDEALAHIRDKGGRAALDLICMSTWSSRITEVSVDTYIGNRNTSRYSIVKQDDVEVLVSSAIAPFVSNVHLDLKKFMFMRTLKAKLELQNGLVVGA